MEIGGPPWLVLTASVMGLVGVIVTAVVGPMVVERRKLGRITPEPSEPAAIAQRVSDAVTLIQSSIADLQNRVGRLEAMQMMDAHDQRG